MSKRMRTTYTNESTKGFVILGRLMNATEGGGLGQNGIIKTR